MFRPSFLVLFPPSVFYLLFTMGFGAGVQIGQTGH